MRILFVIIFTPFLHRGCNFTLLGIYSNRLLLAQGHFYNYICLWIHIGRSEVIFFFLCSLGCKAKYDGTASYFTFSDLESGFWPACSFKPRQTPRFKRLANRVLVQGKNNCQRSQHVSAEKAISNGENVEQAHLWGGLFFIVVIRQQLWLTVHRLDIPPIGPSVACLVNIVRSTCAFSLHKWAEV